MNLIEIADVKLSVIQDFKQHGSKLNFLMFFNLVLKKTNEKSEVFFVTILIILQGL